MKLCPSCKGAKKVMGLGAMYHECKECKGVGHVKGSDEPQVMVTLDKDLDESGGIKEPVIVKGVEGVEDGVYEMREVLAMPNKRRGRPKGWKKT